MKISKLILAVFVTLSFIGCATYYQKNIQFQKLFFNGDFELADKALSSNKKGETGINRLLYFCNRGTTKFMLGEFEESNAYFNKADSYIDTYSADYASEALALISNPMLKPYKAEDFESVTIHFYKALNYINLNNYEDAIVECRRVELVLRKMSEKYKQEGKHYRRDAFAHNLMGIIYDAAGNTNDAFIAYRNAVTIYEEDYIPLFNTQIPTQLKKDLIRTANKMGFGSEQEFFERKFGITYNPEEDADKGSLISFWLNGQGPIKAEWSIMLSNIGTSMGFVTFANEEMGFSFPIYIGNYNSSTQEDLKSLSFIRMAFPKYVERPQFYTQASLRYNNEEFPFEMGENFNNIAFQSLKDRMWREISNSIARVALKKAMESAARSQNEYLGAALSITNMLTERADTRNWQTLPYSINYNRIFLEEGEYTLQFSPIKDGNFTNTKEHQCTIKKGRTSFATFMNLESNYAPKESY